MFRAVPSHSADSPLRCVEMVQIYELCFLVRRLAQVVDRNRESYLASALFDDEFL